MVSSKANCPLKKYIYLPYLYYGQYVVLHVDDLDLHVNDRDLHDCDHDLHHDYDHVHHGRQIFLSSSPTGQVLKQSVNKTINERI